MRGHWLGNSVTLGKPTTKVHQHGPVLQRLDAFRYDRAVERLCEAHHAFDNPQATGILKHHPHKTLVDFEQLDWQVQEIG